MLVSDINDYRTENIVHPSKDMSTYDTKFAFLLKDNNNNNNIKRGRLFISNHIYPWPLFKHAPVQAEALICVSTVCFITLS